MVGKNAFFQCFGKFECIESVYGIRPGIERATSFSARV